VKASSIISPSSWSTICGVGLRPECGLMGECSGLVSFAGGLSCCSATPLPARAAAGLARTAMGGPPRPGMRSQDSSAAGLHHGVGSLGDTR